MLIKNKRLVLILVSLFFIGILIFFSVQNEGQKKWSVETKEIGKDSLPWTSFYWAGDSIGDKYFDRIALYVPMHFEGLPYRFAMQFDSGIPFTEVDENFLDSLYILQPQLKSRLKRNKKWFIVWNRKKHFEDLGIQLDKQLLTGGTINIHYGLGEHFTTTQLQDSSFKSIGSLGCDILADKVLILDYPNLRLCITDSIPELYNKNLRPISLDEVGRPLLPLSINDKKFSLLFDIGSSVFSLITSSQRIKDFTSAKATDTISIYSWGVQHQMPGYLTKDSFTIAGYKFPPQLIYGDQRKDIKYPGGDQLDGITGNALFWNKTLVINFRTKEFGLF